MASIQILEEITASQIAAGEMVDRPSAVVKELLENSIDAGATQITVFFKQGGREQMEVQDNGCGIPPIELPLALQRHATSKIRKLSDLNTIYTMGFRGEALAAISAVSRFQISSRAKGQPIGRTITCESSKILNESNLARSEGTTVKVENLFFNTPARKKFLRSPSAETNHCKQTILRIALVCSHCSFTLKIDGKQHFHLPAQKEIKKRIYDVFSLGFKIPLQDEKEFLPFHYKEESRSISGYILPMEYCLPTSRNIITFVNKRLVKDKIMQQAILAAAKEVLFGQQYPQIVLFLEMDPQMVDVNVHPTKEELRFRDPSPFSFIYKSLLDTLTQLRLPRVENKQTRESALEKPNEIKKNTPASPPTLPLELGRKYEQKAAPQPQKALPNNIPMLLGTIKNTYLVCQDSEGLLLVDQHAAHERITYERLRKQQLKNNLHSSALLIPITVELGAEQLDLLEKKFAKLSELGLHLERSAPTQLRVTELPSLLIDKWGSPTVQLNSLIQKLAFLLEEQSEVEPLLHLIQRALLEVMATQSCHSSVRAGQSLSSLEANALLEKMQTTDYAAHCPHGRPTSVRLKWKEIEKLFKRIP